MNHDALFKELIRTFFHEFLELFAPDVAKAIDRKSIEFLDKEILANAQLKESHEADLVVKVRYKGQPACFIVHVETQASARSGFAERMFMYCSGLYAKYRLPIYPVAVFSYDKPVRPEPDRFTMTVAGLEVLRFQFLTIQLNRLNWREFARKKNPVAAALLVKMPFAAKHRVRVKLECLRMIVTLQLNKATHGLIWGFGEAYLKLTARENAKMFKEIKSLMPREREEVMELTNTWIEEGIKTGMKTGLEKGIKKGIDRGMASTILRQLRHRFGAGAEKLTGAVQGLSHDQLDKLSEALLNFSSLAEARSWVTSHKS